MEMSRQERLGQLSRLSNQNMEREGRIRWYGKVHGRLVNFNTYTNLSEDETFSLYHHKDIVRQVKQNNFYDQLQG
jgi:hypothetical protein